MSTLRSETILCGPMYHICVPHTLPSPKDGAEPNLWQVQGPLRVLRWGKCLPWKSPQTEMGDLLTSHWRSQLEAIFAFQGTIANVWKHFCSSPGKCYCHLVSRSQRCCQTPYNVQNSPTLRLCPCQPRIIRLKMSIVPRCRNSSRENEISVITKEEARCKWKYRGNNELLALQSTYPEPCSLPSSLLTLTLPGSILALQT